MEMTEEQAAMFDMQRAEGKVVYSNIDKARILWAAPVVKDAGNKVWDGTKWLYGKAAKAYKNK